MRKALFLVCLTASFNCACSFIFVKGPPTSVEKLPPSEPVSCTTSKAAPIIDTLIGGYQVFRTGYALSRTEADYAGAPIKRDADIGFGVGLAALFVASSIYGYVVTGQCADAQKAHEGQGPKPNDAPAASQTFTFAPNRPRPIPINPEQAPLANPAPGSTVDTSRPASPPTNVAPSPTAVAPAPSSTPAPEAEPALPKSEN